jgi:hypothetical protein
MPITSAPTHSRCTPPYLRVHFIALCLQVKFCRTLQESLRVEQISFCISKFFSPKIKENIKRSFTVICPLGYFSNLMFFYRAS